MKTGYIFALVLFIAGLTFTVLGAVLLTKHNALGMNIPTCALAFLSIIFFANSFLCYIAESYKDEDSALYPLYRKL